MGNGLGNASSGENRRCYQFKAGKFGGIIQL